MPKQPLAYHDQEFLESADARPIRLLAEYLEPARRFRRENIQDTVVFFGSARVHSRQDAERALEGAAEEARQEVGRLRDAAEADAQGHQVVALLRGGA